jgi:hypothetical protein
MVQQQGKLMGKGKQQGRSDGKLLIFSLEELM